MQRMRLEKLTKERILILGLGKEGKDNYLALRRLFPKKVLGVADKLELEDLAKNTQRILRADRKLKLHFGKDYLRALKDYNLIIKTPGIPQSTLKPFLKKGSQVASQTEIFFENYKGTIVGVTGTKGKGTTSSLIYQILKKRGFKAHLVGNIGKPVFQTLLRIIEKNESLKTEKRLSSAKRKRGLVGRDVFVYELSSHQLQNLKKSPHIAVFLNLFPDHLDYYSNLKEYQKAKENIALHQKKDDFFIYNADDKLVRAIAKETKAQKIPFTLKPKPIRCSRCLRICYNCFVKGDWVFCGEEKIIPKKEIPLKGDFNLLNVMAAVLVGKISAVPSKRIRQAIKSFRPLLHRLEFVGKYKGIQFYNDSMSTIPEVTIAALAALGRNVKTLILGGSSKGSDYSLLAKEILKRELRTVILFPDTGNEIWQTVKRAHQESSSLKKLPKAFFVSSMKEAVMIAFELTRKEEICLLSPASASFTLFRNYRERGNLFKRLIKTYAKN